MCPSYGLLVHVHNDTMATLLCKVLGKGDTGLAEDVPLPYGYAVLKNISVTADLNVSVGEEISDNCNGMNRSLAIWCMSEYNLKITGYNLFFIEC